MEVVVGAERHDPTVGQAIVNHAVPYTRAIEVVGIHEMHSADEQKIKVEIAQVLVIATFDEADEQIFQETRVEGS